MTDTANASIPMDADLKAQSEVSMNQPNMETVAVMLEAERIAKDPSVKGYNDLDELFADLKK